MTDRETIEKIFAIMRRLLLVKMDGLNPIPRKGTTRRECYQALYEIQELLETRRISGKHLPQTNADRIRALTDEELAMWINSVVKAAATDLAFGSDKPTKTLLFYLRWLKQEATP